MGNWETAPVKLTHHRDRRTLDTLILASVFVGPKEARADGLRTATKAGFEFAPCFSSEGG